jgi:hypothetical protein
VNFGLMIHHEHTYMSHMLHCFCVSEITNMATVRNVETISDKFNEVGICTVLHKSNKIALMIVVHVR